MGTQRHALDWKIQDVVVVPVPALPDIVDAITVDEITVDEITVDAITVDAVTPRGSTA